MGAIDGWKVGAIVAALAVGGEAGAFPHVVRAGDNPGGLAERFYGRIDRERIVVAANQLDTGGGSSVLPGMRLEIPAVSHHLVLQGESWPSIAAAKLGGSARAEVLARINKSNPWEPPAAGREVILPYPLRHVASQGDTAESLAYRFLGKRDDAWMVLSFNGLQRPRLAQGEVILVPVSDLTLTDAGKAAAREASATTASESGGRVKERQESAARDLNGLAAKVRDGGYVEAIALGAGVLGQGELTEAQLARAHELLTEAYVAVGEGRLASASCARWKKLAPSLELDPVRHSPKILAACAALPAVEVERAP
ncbi:MAG: LysM domain-containing protein [Deltaproteobacteria bacterium]|nr:LysM domain-containing protein [Deltaproteobacteria bacterium]